MTDGNGWINSSLDSGTLVLTAGGVWNLDTLPSLARDLRPLISAGAAQKLSSARIVADDITRLDSAGAWLLYRTSRELTEAGLTTEIEGVRKDSHHLLDRAAQAAEHAREHPEPRPPNPFVRELDHFGRRAVESAVKTVELTNFLGFTIMGLGAALVHPRRMHVRAIAKHIEQIGLHAVPIIGLLSLLVGLVVAYMGAVQLKKFGAEILTVDLVGIALLRELGVLFAAILVAGRSGSAFTAQIGTMKLNQEIDAMQTIGLQPVDVLVLPRIVAMMIALPLLTVYADLVGLAGGALISWSVLDISVPAFLEELSNAVSEKEFFIGFVKAPVFAFAIALVGCFEGLKVTGSAESVGSRTTTSVVESIFLVLVIDAAFAIALSFLGI